MKNQKRITAFILCILLLSTLLLHPLDVAAGKVSKRESTDAKTGVTASFEVTMLNVYQGLCVLIESDGHYMLYDGGGRKRSSYVVSYLQKQKITSFDYVFVSHYDEDHISGLVGVMRKFTVKKIITPNYEGDSDIYISFSKTLTRQGIPEIHPVKGDEFVLGNSTIRVLSADSSAEKENNRSTVIRISSDNYSCILTGDAEAETEESILKSRENINSDVYVVGHHGSASSSTSSFVKAISPSCALISVGKDNSYGHPTEEVLQTLEDNDCEIYRTDKQKEIIVSYDGKSSWWCSDEPYVRETSDNSADADILDPFATDTDSSTNTAPSDRSIPNSSESVSSHYILNTNTGKFHYPSCKSVKQMKDKNKREMDCSREELITAGYDPCQNCNP